jgi:hypothetical protein
MASVLKRGGRGAHPRRGGGHGTTVSGTEDVVTSQGHLESPGAGRSRKKPPLEPLEGTWPCGHQDSDPGLQNVEKSCFFESCLWSFAMGAQKTCHLRLSMSSEGHRGDARSFRTQFNTQSPCSQQAPCHLHGLSFPLILSRLSGQAIASGQVCSAWCLHPHCVPCSPTSCPLLHALCPPAP